MKKNICIGIVFSFIIANVIYAQDKFLWKAVRNINSPFHEFSPSISPDGSFMVFASSRKEGLGDKDLWISYYLKNEWSKPINLTTLNSRYHDQEPFLTYDGNAILFSSDRDGGYGVGDIYIAYRNATAWTRPINLGPVINTKYSEKMPSLSMDNKELFFARIPVDFKKRSLEMKKIQIFSSLRTGNRWQVPVQLASPVNMLSFDCAPRIMPDNRFLLFCSAREGGYGSYDVWMAEREKRGAGWIGITNLKSINTDQNEVYFTFTISGDRMYLASLRDSKNNYDIYEYKVEKPILQPTITLQGRITNIVTGEPVEAEITVELFTNAKEKFSIKSSKTTGEYSVTLPHGGDYSVTAEAPGYMFHSQRNDLKKLENAEVVQQNIGLHPLKVGENIVLRTVYFDPDSAKLRDASKIALDRMVDLLKKNPKVRVLIKGHVADVPDSRIDSQLLSHQRADAVKQYLIEKGIKNSRLESKGYGHTQSIGDNHTEEGRNLNRRTEFEILP